MADDSGEFDSSNPWMKNNRTAEPSFKKKKHGRYFDPVEAETDPSHSTRQHPSRRFKVDTGIAYDPKSEFPREEKPILEAKIKKEKVFVANLKRPNTWKGGLSRFQKKNLQDDRKYPGKAPVPQDRLDRHSRGEGMNPQGVQTKFYTAKLKKREADIEQSIEQAARTELLLAEDGGFLEADVGECTRQYTQQQIAAAVDITSATKHFELQLSDFGPYRMDYNRSGRYLLLGGRKGHVAAIDWLTKRLLCEMNVMEEVFDISWLHIETMFAVAQKNWVYVYDNQGIELHCLKQLNHVLRMEFLPYHFLLATANEGGYLSWLDISIGKIISQLNTRQGRLNVVTQNPANATICLGHTKGTVTMWSPTVRTPLAQLLCHQHPVQAITVDPSGRYMATAGVDRTLKLWDLRMVRGNLQEYRMRAAATNLAFSQRRLLAVGMGNTVEAMSFIAAAWGGVTQATIFNCMRKAGFHFRGDEAEEVPGGPMAEVEEPVINESDWASLGGQGSFDDFVRADSAIVTSALLSLDDIIHDHDGDSDVSEEEEFNESDVPVPVPTSSEVVGAFESVQAFLLSKDLDAEEQAILTKMNNILFKHSICSGKQNKITDYFK